MSGLLASFLQPLKHLTPKLQVAAEVSGINFLLPETFNLSSIRTKVRCYFPRPNEVRRVRRHGWETRMSTHNGRKIIMRRILKGRYVLSH
ncbi:unnamed protein product [Chilo suppressalis]|uniref:Large ribosomal subunit protein bL34m n=1 Tax=Chilo suppressalis TaxID=168631 RepID=A0ABN8AWN5_CHISP|nr:hypothetical protein evm_003915 [Chilo suppressalis]CAH0399412.1 unnamed protein product [Chilo suppressalis]